MSNLFISGGGRTVFVASLNDGAPVVIPTLIFEDPDEVVLHQAEVLYKLRKVLQALKRVEDVIGKYFSLRI